MKKSQHKRILAIVAILLVMVTSASSRVYAFNTDYPEKSVREAEDNENKDKEIGIAVIEKENVTEVSSYYYLFYDAVGEIHIVEYIQNPIRSQWDENAKEKKRWVLKSDADNIKAKELGAKEFYTDEKEIKNNEKKEATELYKKITEEIGNKSTLYDYIEGETEDEEPYTIESVLFNKVPIFDINFFSEKAAGKALKDNSAVSIIRKLIATWYVTFRNIAFIALAILIVYYGIRLAISSIASERANYKRILISWIKSLLIVLMIHYIMYIVIYFNESLVNLIATSSENEVSIYNTIKTRALEAPLKVAVPATILYFTLLFMWIRFLFAYFKRTFDVAFLVILAPLVAIRYSIESASGKGSQMVTEWIQRFTTSVFIQSIHAMIYAVFVKNALEIALEDLKGFIIALFFLNFILAADKIFIDIFKFEFHSSTLGRIKKQFRPAKELVEWKAGYEVGKRAFGVAKDITIEAKDVTANTLNRGYVGVMDTLDDKYGGNHRREVEDKLKAIPDSFNDTIQNIIVGDELDENGRPIEMGRIKTNINRHLKLKKLSRKRGIEGAKAKRILKKKKNITKKRYLSEFKIMRDLASGVTGTVLAIPIIAASDNPASEIATIMQLPAIFSSATRNAKTINRISKKSDKEFDRVVKNVNLVNKKMDKIEKELDNISSGQKKQTIDELKSINSINANSHSIQEALYRYIEKNKVKRIDNEELELIISDIVNNMHGDLEDEERERIKENAKRIIIQNHRKNNQFVENEDDNKKYANEDAKKERISFRTSNNNKQQSEINVEKEGETDGSKESEVDLNFVEYKEPVEDIEITSDNTVEGQENKEKGERNSNIENTIQEDKEGIDFDQKQENGVFSFGEIIKGIEEAVIDEKASNKFTADLAKLINEIKDINNRMEGQPGERTVADTNKFLDSL